jgi:hypothetical protein
VEKKQVRAIKVTELTITAGVRERHVINEEIAWLLVRCTITVVNRVTKLTITAGVRGKRVINEKIARLLVRCTITLVNPCLHEIFLVHFYCV